MLKKVFRRILDSTHLVSTYMSRAMVYPTTSLEQSGGLGNVVMVLARGRGPRPCRVDQAEQSDAIAAACARGSTAA